jgi:hypothetical protein
VVQPAADGRLFLFTLAYGGSLTKDAISGRSARKRNSLVWSLLNTGLTRSSFGDAAEAKARQEMMRLRGRMTPR